MGLCMLILLHAIIPCFAAWMLPCIYTFWHWPFLAKKLYSYLVPHPQSKFASYIYALPPDHIFHEATCCISTDLHSLFFRTAIPTLLIESDFNCGIIYVTYTSCTVLQHLCDVHLWKDFCYSCSQVESVLDQNSGHCSCR